MTVTPALLVFGLMQTREHRIGHLTAWLPLAGSVRGALLFVVAERQAPAITSALHGVEHKDAGLGSGLVNTCHELGASLGVVAVAGAALLPKGRPDPSAGPVFAH
jgi:hypothetical protein